MNNVIQFVTQNQAVLAGLVVAALDLVIALNKNVEANGIFHAVYIFFQGLIKKDPPAA